MVLCVKSFLFAELCTSFTFQQILPGKKAKTKPEKLQPLVQDKEKELFVKTGSIFPTNSWPLHPMAQGFFNVGCITHVITRLLGSNEINYLIAVREVGMTMSAPTQREHDILFKRVVCRRNVAPSFILRLSIVFALISRGWKKAENQASIYCRLFDTK